MIRNCARLRMPVVHSAERSGRPHHRGQRTNPLPLFQRQRVRCFRKDAKGEVPVRRRQLRILLMPITRFGPSPSVVSLHVDHRVRPMLIRGDVGPQTRGSSPRRWQRPPSNRPRRRRRRCRCEHCRRGLSGPDAPSGGADTDANRDTAAYLGQCRASLTHAPPLPCSLIRSTHRRHPRRRTSDAPAASAARGQYEGSAHWRRAVRVMGRRMPAHRAVARRRAAPRALRSADRLPRRGRHALPVG